MLRRPSWLRRTMIAIYLACMNPGGRHTELVGDFSHRHALREQPHGDAPALQKNSSGSRRSPTCLIDPSLDPNDKTCSIFRHVVRPARRTGSPAPRCRRLDAPRPGGPAVRQPGRASEV